MGHRSTAGGTPGLSRRPQRHKYHESGTRLGLCELEQGSEVRGRELLWRSLQEHLDARGDGDVGVALVLASEGGSVHFSHKRLHARKILTIFGEVSATRMGYGARGEESVHLLDAELCLPGRTYSYEIGPPAHQGRRARALRRGDHPHRRDDPGARPDAQRRGDREGRGGRLRRLLRTAGSRTSEYCYGPDADQDDRRPLRRARRYRPGESVESRVRFGRLHSVVVLLGLVGTNAAWDHEGTSTAVKTALCRPRGTLRRLAKESFAEAIGHRDYRGTQV
jgi:hypothetical protein